MKIFDTASPEKKTSVDAIDSVSGEMSQQIKEKVLSKIPIDATKTKGLLINYLHLAENFPAELFININIIIKKLDFRAEGSNS